MYDAMLDELTDHFYKTAYGYLLDNVGKPKTRKFRAEAPREKYRVKQAMSAMDPAKRLAASQKVGMPKMEQPKVKPLGMKLAFATSQYSGGPGEGPLRRYASHIPPFRQPQLKTAGPPSEKTLAREKTAMLDEFCKLNAVQSPEAQITSSQKVGAPRTTAPPGPSIQQISKPVGYGRALAGATKSL